MVISNQFANNLGGYQRSQIIPSGSYFHRGATLHVIFYISDEGDTSYASGLSYHRFLPRGLDRRTRPPTMAARARTTDLVSPSACGWVRSARRGSTRDPDCRKDRT